MRKAGASSCRLSLGRQDIPPARRSVAPAQRSSTSPSSHASRQLKPSTFRPLTRPHSAHVCRDEQGLFLHALATAPLEEDGHAATRLASPAFGITKYDALLVLESKMALNPPETVCPGLCRLFSTLRAKRETYAVGVYKSGGPLLCHSCSSSQHCALFASFLSLSQSLASPSRS